MSISGLSISPRTVAIIGLLALTGALALTLATGSSAADLPLLPGHSPVKRLPPPKDASRMDMGMRLEEFAQGPNAACTAWTDGCRSCGKGGDGVFCSNVGFACVPTQPRCTRR
jgi:hypothetical protein